MATPSSLAIAQGKMEAIEAVKREFTSNRGHNPLGLPTEIDGKPVELALVPFRGDEEGERHVRSNMLCKLLAERPKLLHRFNSLMQAHQILALMLQEPAGQNYPLKEWFLEASGAQRHEVWQVICSQEGASDWLRYEMELRHFESFFRE